MLDLKLYIIEYYNRIIKIIFIKIIKMFLEKKNIIKIIKFLCIVIEIIYV